MFPGMVLMIALAGLVAVVLGACMATKRLPRGSAALEADYEAATLYQATLSSECLRAGPRTGSIHLSERIGQSTDVSL